MRKIVKSLEEIVGHQEFEREKEVAYKKLHEQFSNNYFYWVCLQIVVVIVCAAFSVVSLRRFFVKKSIY